MATGTIKRLVKDRGYGFIQPEGSSQEVFFHKSSLESGTFEDLAEGGTVEFESEPDPKQPDRNRAARVRPA
ncbi:MAG: cold shock domain-containing protein [Dehalococcoidia bacterium]